MESTRDVVEDPSTLKNEVRVREINERLAFYMHSALWLAAETDST